MDKVWIHGEVVIKKIKGVLPDGCRKVEFKNGVFKIANSETTGNHHLLEEIDGCDMYEKDGVLYFRNTENAVVRCVDEKRHDTFTVEPCEEDEILVIYPQKEVDHLTDEIQAVSD